MLRKHDDMSSDLYNPHKELVMISNRPANPALRSRFSGNLV